MDLLELNQKLPWWTDGLIELIELMGHVITRNGKKSKGNKANEIWLHQKFTYWSLPEYWLTYYIGRFHLIYQWTRQSQKASAKSSSFALKSFFMKMTPSYFPFCLNQLLKFLYVWLGHTCILIFENIFVAFHFHDFKAHNTIDNTDVIFCDVTKRWTLWEKYRVFHGFRLNFVFRGILIRATFDYSNFNEAAVAERTKHTGNYTIPPSTR